MAREALLIAVGLFYLFGAVALLGLGPTVLVGVLVMALRAIFKPTEEG